MLQSQRNYNGENFIYCLGSTTRKKYLVSHKNQREEMNIMVLFSFLGLVGYVSTFMYCMHQLSSKKTKSYSEYSYKPLNVSEKDEEDEEHCEFQTNPPSFTINVEDSPPTKRNINTSSPPSPEWIIT